MSEVRHFKPFDDLIGLLQGSRQEVWSQRALTYHLCRCLIEQSPEGYGLLKVPLEEWINATYGTSINPADQERARQAAEKRILAIADPKERTLCLRFIARAGHLYQMAGLIAADNINRPHGRYQLPTQAEEFLSKNLNRGIGSTLKSLNAPSIEMTLTAHPTNTTSVEAMREERLLGQLLRRCRDGEDVKGDLQRAMRSFAGNPMLPIGPDNMPRNISVLEETDYMLNYLTNAYEDLPELYHDYDHALQKRYGAEYDPEMLNLQVHFHSWGSSGDKDGNVKVNAGTTLYAIAAHYQEALEHYSQLLTRAGAVPLAVLRAQGRKERSLDTWAEKIRHAKEISGTIRARVKEKMKDGFLEPAELEKAQQELHEAVGILDKGAFLAALHGSYIDQTAEPAQRDTLLRLIRSVKTFGFSFGKIEYRETSEEFTRLTAALLGDSYKALIPPEDATDEQRAKFDKARSEALSAVLKDPQQLAQLRDRFRSMGHGYEGAKYDKNNVGPIAYQTRQRLLLARDFPQMIDTQVLAECQGASHMLEALLLQRLTDERPPRLGIVPLFEDAEYLKAAPAIITQALAVPTYLAHVKATGGGHPRQQVQFAHSDNSRRNGMPAARALIYQAHRNLRARMAQEHAGIDLQCYEGGSQSDPFRGGARPLTDTVDEFGLQRFFKATFQGGDLLNYMNQPGTLPRLLANTLNHNAEILAKPPARPSITPAVEDTLIAALERAKSQYDDMFSKGGLSSFMKDIDFNKEADAGANGSRATTRDPNAEVNVKGMRTITFSEVLQHAGITPTWLGLGQAQASMQAAGLPTNAVGLNRLYKDSAIFRDIIDRAAFGIIRSDLDYADSRSHQNGLMGALREEYGQAFQLCYQAITGKAARPDITESAQIRKAMTEASCPHAQENITDQDRYLDLMRGIKQQWMPEGGGERDLAMRLLHNGFDTVYHGRLPLIDDPRFAQLYQEQAGCGRK